MEIWIIRNGEKVGPIEDYEVRRRINAGEISPDSPAWHDGLDSWRPFSEIDLFKHEFSQLQKAVKTPEPVKEVEIPSAPTVPVPPPVAPPPRLARRFLARWLDLILYAAVWWLLMWFARRNIEAILLNPWQMFLQFVPWFVLEIILIHKFATTPGKALLGLRVVNSDGSLLTLAASTHRAVRVLIAGIGFGWPLLSIFCQTVSFFTAKKLGKPIWDYLGNHQVESKPLRLWIIPIVIALFYIAAQVQMAVIAPYIFKHSSDLYPALKEQFEKNPPWHLPKRH
jgi:uncharacterized RDD family membrane protein YckC